MAAAFIHDSEAPIPRHFQDAILVDICATLYITLDANDLTNFSPAGKDIYLKGIAKGLRVLGFWDINISYQCNDNEVRKIALRHVGFVSTLGGFLPLRLISPQTLF